MGTHRSRQSQHRSSRSNDRADDGRTIRKAGTAGNHHGTVFDAVDSAVRVFLGPAERSTADLPVVHLHDEAEDTSDQTLSLIDVHVDSLGHHYAQRRRSPEQ